MINVRLIIQDSKETPKGVRSYFEFYAKEGHEIQECTEFRALVQSLMDNKELEFFEDVKGSKGGDVCTLEEGSTPPDINDTSDAVADSESPFEQDMCPEEPQDSENDQDLSHNNCINTMYMYYFHLSKLVEM
ncbi:hypothetical protein GOBAR_DD23129 [Gossypium barbadense]|nr:hypothetical protein GOBAR_DD23129 [Gossypium barbadense]